MLLSIYCLNNSHGKKQLLAFEFFITVVANNTYKIVRKDLKANCHSHFCKKDGFFMT